MQSEKYSNSGANWSRFPTRFRSRICRAPRRSARPAALLGRTARASCSSGCSRRSTATPARTGPASRPASDLGFVERLDDPHVLQPFLAGRLGLPVLQDAVGEVQQLRRELVPLPDPLPISDL